MHYFSLELYDPVASVSGIPHSIMSHCNDTLIYIDGVIRDESRVIAEMLGSSCNGSP